MILVINDPHMSEKPPGARNADYMKQIVAKLVECAKLSQGCDFTVITGDLYHNKNARNVTHRTVRVLIACLKLFKNVYLVEGNHDLIGAEGQSRERQPVGTLYEAGVIKRLQRMDWNGVEIYPLAYNENFESKKEEIILPEVKGKRIIFTHSLLTRKSGLRDKIKGHFDLCCYGHPHEPEGQDGKWVNFGALARTRNESWENRLVQVALVDRGLQVIPVTLENQLPWNEVRIKPTEKEESEYGQEEFVNAFMEAMNFESMVSVSTFEEIVENLPPKVRQRLDHYLGSL